MKTYQQQGKDSLLFLNHRPVKKILVNNVILLKGNINYTTFYLQHGQEKVVARTLKFFEPFLEAHGFLRVHRSFMINPNFIQEYNHEHEFLMMSNGQIANISRRRKHTLRDFKE